MLFYPCQHLSHTECYGPEGGVFLTYVETQVPSRLASDSGWPTGHPQPARSEDRFRIALPERYKVLELAYLRDLDATQRQFAIRIKRGLNVFPLQAGGGKLVYQTPEVLHILLPYFKPGGL